MELFFNRKENCLILRDKFPEINTFLASLGRGDKDYITTKHTLLKFNDIYYFLDKFPTPSKCRGEIRIYFSDPPTRKRLALGYLRNRRMILIGLNYNYWNNINEEKEKIDNPKRFITEILNRVFTDFKYGDSRNLRSFLALWWWKKENLT